MGSFDCSQRRLHLPSTHHCRLVGNGTFAFPYKSLLVSSVLAYCLAGITGHLQESAIQRFPRASLADTSQDHAVAYVVGFVAGSCLFWA